jgi:hypothetical protein
MPRRATPAARGLLISPLGRPSPNCDVLRGCNCKATGSPNDVVSFKAAILDPRAAGTQDLVIDLTRTASLKTVNDHQLSRSGSPAGLADGQKTIEDFDARALHVKRCAVLVLETTWEVCQQAYYNRSEQLERHCRGELRLQQRAPDGRAGRESPDCLAVPSAPAWRGGFVGRVPGTRRAHIPTRARACCGVCGTATASVRIDQRVRGRHHARTGDHAAIVCRHRRQRRRSQQAPRGGTIPIAEAKMATL